ncbi:MAG TPA: zinc ribbon domain-containing protein [Syntrophales bacterium]|nr:zinc ribbon domain-containing protein [Syntrophales bacterium]
MPIYEYKCKKCGKEFEVLQSISAPDAKTCKFCKGPIRKLMSRTTFHLKGSGWYVTDYGGKKAPACEESKTEAAPAASTETAAGGTDSSSTDTPST